MTVDEFCRTFPMFAFDFDRPIGEQPRIYDPLLLDQVPAELLPNHPYRQGGRKRPNLNQTRVHSQCASCLRVLRNDFFYAPPSQRRVNGIFTHCLECTRKINAERYETNAETIRRRRLAVWAYLAPECAICGFNGHASAMDMHHLGSKEALIADLITALTLTGHVARAEALLREASKCVPLCSNCHRMIHAGVLELPHTIERPIYRLDDLMRRVTSA